MTKITLTLTGAAAQAAVSGPLTSAMAGIPVTIVYDEAWEGLTKNLVCRSGEYGAINSEIRTILHVEDASVVAHEVMMAGRRLYLGIEGYSADGKVVIPTTWADCGEILPGANAGADPSADPELTVWNQLQTQIDRIREEPGVVRSVNGVTPDGAGNVELSVTDGTQSGSDLSAGTSTDVNIRKWFGRKIVVDGSSITSGGSGNTLPTWHSFLKDMFALKEVCNHSLTGSGWFIGGTTTTMDRVAEYEADADAVILMGDYNGIYNYTRGLGTIDDEPSLEGLCYARLKYLAETLISKYPLCPIIWVIEPPRASVGETDGLVPMVRDSDQAKYAAVIEEVAEYYGFTHCNLMKNTIFRPWIQANFDATTSDGTHPWNNIQRTMAQVIAETMKRTPLIYNESYVVTPDYSGDDSGGTEDPGVTLTGIKATALSGYTLFENDSLNAVRDCIRVVAVYSDLSEKAVTDYTVAGELAAGTQTFTVSYSGQSAAVGLTVTAGDRTTTILGTDYIDETLLGKYLDGNGDTTFSRDGMFVSRYIAVKPGSTITFSGIKLHGLTTNDVAFYDADYGFISTFNVTNVAVGKTTTVPEGAAYFRFADDTSSTNTITYVPG